MTAARSRQVLSYVAHKKPADALAEGYRRFRADLLGQLSELRVNGLDLSEFGTEPGVVKFRDSYCLFYLDRFHNRLRIAFGKEGQRISPYDFSLLPVISGGENRAVLYWTRPYDDRGEALYTDFLVRHCLDTLLRLDRP